MGKRGRARVRPPIPLPHPALTAGALRLRAPADGDAPRIYEACCDAEIVRYTRMPANYTMCDAQAFVDEASARRELGVSLELVASDLPDGTLVGVVGLVADRYDPARAEIGYWTHPAHRGRGVALGALRMMAGWALTGGAFARLDLTASVNNHASLRVAERAGFCREGTARSSWPTVTGRDDMAVFSLLPSDLERMRPGDVRPNR